MTADPCSVFVLFWFGFAAPVADMLGSIQSRLAEVNFPFLVMHDPEGERERERERVPTDSPTIYPPVCAPFMYVSSVHTIYVRIWL